MPFSKISSLFLLVSLAILFQNFTYEDEPAALFPSLSLAKGHRAPALENQDAREVIQQMNQYKEPSVADGIVPPQSGNDWKSVMGNWADKQGHAWMNGADERFLKNINDHLNSWLSNDNAAAEEGATPSPLLVDEKKKSDWKFTRVNVLQYQVDESSKVIMHVETDGGHVDYSQAIDPRTSLGIEHKSASNQTQFLLKYNW